MTRRKWKLYLFLKNYCVDKNVVAINSIKSNDKSVVDEDAIPDYIITTVLKSDIRLVVNKITTKYIIGFAFSAVVGEFDT